MHEVMLIFIREGEERRRRGYERTSFKEVTEMTNSKVERQ